MEEAAAASARGKGAALAGGGGLIFFFFPFSFEIGVFFFPRFSSLSTLTTPLFRVLGRGMQHAGGFSE